MNLPKKLLIINDMAGVGRCSMTAALPVVSACKVQACPVPTAIFSNHTGYPTFYRKNLYDSLPEYFAGLMQLSTEFDGIYCGYLGSTAPLDSLRDYLTCYCSAFKTLPVVILDPVMGDHGRMYTSITQDFCHKLQDFLSFADIITPNLTEACLLTDTPYPDTTPTLEELIIICQKLQTLGAHGIVITGIADGILLHNFIYEDVSSHELISIQSEGPGYPGTGDIFTSILSALLLRGFSLRECVEHASTFLAFCIRETDKLYRNETNLSEQKDNPEEYHHAILQGVAFELFLDWLTKI